MEAIRVTISDLTRSSALSGSPRSSKTFPLLRSTGISPLPRRLPGRFAPARMFLPGSFEPLPDKVQFFLGRFDAPLRLLLKGEHGRFTIWAQGRPASISSLDGHSEARAAARAARRGLRYPRPNVACRSGGDFGADCGDARALGEGVPPRLNPQAGRAAGDRHRGGLSLGPGAAGEDGPRPGRGPSGLRRAGRRPAAGHAFSGRRCLRLHPPPLRARPDPGTPALAGPAL